MKKTILLSLLAFSPLFMQCVSTVSPLSKWCTFKNNLKCGDVYNQTDGDCWCEPIQVGVEQQCKKACKAKNAQWTREAKLEIEADSILCLCKNPLPQKKK